MSVKIKEEKESFVLEKTDEGLVLLLGLADDYFWKDWHASEVGYKYWGVDHIKKNFNEYNISKRARDKRLTKEDIFTSAKGRGITVEFLD